MRVTILCAVIALVVCSNLCAQIPALTTTVVGSATNGLSAPLYVCSPPGDLNRLFVVQKGGLIKVRTPANAAGAWTTCLDVSALVSTGSEQGLLGMAFHPNFATNGYIFIYYTAAPSPGFEVVRRYTIPAGSDVASPATGVTFLSVADPESNHNGGTVQFGPDGYLYIAIGDGGGGNDQHGTCGNAQDTTVLLGKMLRINDDVPNGSIPYSIPPGNPFAGNATEKEIFHYGLRNPFRWCFDRLTGDMWIGDVGQNAVEEVDFLPAGTAGGRNFGWRCKEGNTTTNL